MSFPLADWILAHEGVPHDLAQSGMKGQLRTALPALRQLRPGDPKELRERLAALNGVGASRVVLTTGATTANGLVILYLAREIRRRRGRSPRAQLCVPEYPPLRDAAAQAGFRVTRHDGGSDIAILSNPNNPEGTRLEDEELFRRTRGVTWRVVDETFREFSAVPSIARRADEETWVTGTFTKAYGADSIRVGFAIPPPAHARAFADHAELWADRLSPFSVGGALALLDRRDLVLNEARGIFQRNVRELTRRLGGVQELSAPMWFDRSHGEDDVEVFARRALRKGVLVCPGTFFSDRSGIRLCLTSRKFPQDLGAYLDLTERRAPEVTLLPPNLGKEP